MATPLDYARKTYHALLIHGKSTLFTTYVDNYDPSTGVNTRTPTSLNAQSSPYLSYETKYIDGDLILQGDAFIIIADYNLAFIPVPGMQVDTNWFTVSVKPYNYQDSTVAYEIQLRKT